MSFTAFENPNYQGPSMSFTTPVNSTADASALSRRGNATVGYGGFNSFRISPNPDHRRRHVQVTFINYPPDNCGPFVSRVFESNGTQNVEIPNLNEVSAARPVAYPGWMRVDYYRPLLQKVSGEKLLEGFTTGVSAALRRAGSAVRLLGTQLLPSAYLNPMPLAAEFRANLRVTIGWWAPKYDASLGYRVSIVNGGAHPSVRAEPVVYVGSHFGYDAICRKRIVNELTNAARGGVADVERQFNGQLSQAPAGLEARFIFDVPNGSPFDGVDPKSDTMLALIIS